MLRLAVFFALKKRADANSFKAADVMRRARLADGLHRLKVSVLRGYKRAIMITIITITNVFDIKQKVMLWFRYFKLKY